MAQFKATLADYHDGTQGICLSCGQTQYGVEPDAEGYVCESCGEHKVIGLEMAVVCDLVEITDIEDVVDPLDQFRD